ncbi:MAG TPA: response regulator transcription factor [Actinomycetota bacterium]|nr:response regulator transcription factor [Actinomycetota bacterium]
MTRILVVEDEARIAAFVEKGLRAEGFVVVACASVADASAQLRTEDFDLVVLDLGLPDGDGLDVLRAMRERGLSIPVVILTARDGVRATVAGFDEGADDYVTKPFRFEELLARVRARLRPRAATDASLLEVGDLALDLRTRRLRVGDRETELTAREFVLAETFFTHPGQVLSREQLLSRVWGYDHDPGSNVVDVYVGYLRKKVGADTIATVRGMGYRLQPPRR